MESSLIPDTLIAHYHTATYQVMMKPNPITLSMGQRCKSLAQIFASSSQQNAVFITAFNPFSQLKNSEENLINNKRLLLLLKCHTDQIIKAVSTDPSEQWAVEESFLALGINLKTAKSLGMQFKQNAIVWIGANATPELILLR